MKEDCRSGMWTGDAQPVPLRGVAIEVEVQDAASRVTVTQRFQNVEKTPIEAVYSFPLEEGSAVCGFEAEVDGRRIVGRGSSTDVIEASVRAYLNAINKVVVRSGAGNGK